MACYCEYVNKLRSLIKHESSSTTEQSLASQQEVCITDVDTAANQVNAQMYFPIGNRIKIKKYKRNNKTYPFIARNALYYHISTVRLPHHTSLYSDIWLNNPIINSIVFKQPETSDILLCWG